MDFGICVAPRPADIEYVVEAERLGFTHAWMADSQMIWSDVYAMLALAADRTSTINLGTGVAVAGTRIAPVTAAAIATINELAPGEATDSDRVKEQVGAFAIAALHYADEQYSQFGRRPGSHLLDVWDDYVAAVEETPVERRHLRTHLGHNCWVIPEEERFVTRELIERSCLVGTADELRARVADLDAAGLDQIVLLPPLDAKDQAISDAARVLIGPAS